MKKQTKKNRACLVFVVVLAFLSLTLPPPAGAQCPPPGYPDYTIPCDTYDVYYGYLIWCCPTTYPICGDNYLECFPETPVTTTTPYTTTIPGPGTSTIPSSTTTTIPGTATTTIPGTVTTTTVPTPTVGDFIVGINVNGQNSPWAEPSGFLPGTSPQRVAPMLYRADGRLIPIWYDDVRHLDIKLLRESKQLTASRRSVQAAYVLSVGEQKSFWVKDKNDASWRQVQATCQREGQHSFIFVDNSITVPASALDTYVTEFDMMYRIVADNIGEFVDRDGNGKVAILFYDFNDGGTANMYMAGYFWSKDYFEDSVASQRGIRSNEMDIIYIRGDEPQGWEQTGVDLYQSLLSTLIHEYQHLVNFCITLWSQGNNGNYADVWINEMMSMATETMYFQEKIRENPFFSVDEVEGNGYLAYRLLYYNRDARNSIRNGHGLTYWDNNGDTLANYSLSYLFGMYLVTHASNGFGIFKQILDYMVTNKIYNFQAVAAVASQRIDGISSWEDLLKSFVIANMANQPTGLFGYKGNFILTPHGPTMPNVRINCGGAVYRSVTGEVSTPAGAGPNIRFFDDSGNPLPGGGGACPASVALGEGTNENNTLRMFRDSILRKTPEGSALIEGYYRFAPEVASLLLQDQSLKQQVRNLLIELQPALRTAIKTKRCSITSHIEKQLDIVCDYLLQKASPELCAFIEKVQYDFVTGRLFEKIGIEKE
ncbi:MAG: hypothetical protein N3B18_04975 [Desulfobacterota bacterium]|nr:hypothetical protein [Thermodesulfobacteriota bacterium]